MPRPAAAGGALRPRLPPASRLSGRGRPQGLGPARRRRLVPQLRGLLLRALSPGPRRPSPGFDQVLSPRDPRLGRAGGLRQVPGVPGPAVDPAPARTEVPRSRRPRHLPVRSRPRGPPPRRGRPPRRSDGGQSSKDGALSSLRHQRRPHRDHQPAALLALPAPPGVPAGRQPGPGRLSRFLHRPRRRQPFGPAGDIDDHRPPRRPPSLEGCPCSQHHRRERLRPSAGQSVEPLRRRIPADLRGDADHHPVHAAARPPAAALAVQAGRPRRHVGRGGPGGRAPHRPELQPRGLLLAPPELPGYPARRGDHGHRLRVPAAGRRRAGRGRAAGRGPEDAGRALRHHLPFFGRLPGPVHPRSYASRMGHGRILRDARL